MLFFRGVRISFFVAFWEKSKGIDLQLHALSANSRTYARSALIAIFFGAIEGKRIHRAYALNYMRNVACKDILPIGGYIEIESTNIRKKKMGE